MFSSNFLTQKSQNFFNNIPRPEEKVTDTVSITNGSKFFPFSKDDDEKKYYLVSLREHLKELTKLEQCFSSRFLNLDIENPSTGQTWDRLGQVQMFYYKFHLACKDSRKQMFQQNFIQLIPLAKKMFMNLYNFFKYDCEHSKLVLNLFSPENVGKIEMLIQNQVPDFELVTVDGFYSEGKRDWLKQKGCKFDSHLDFMFRKTVVEKITNLFGCPHDVEVSLHKEFYSIPVFIGWVTSIMFAILNGEKKIFVRKFVSNFLLCEKSSCEFQILSSIFFKKFFYIWINKMSNFIFIRLANFPKLQTLSKLEIDEFKTQQVFENVRKTYYKEMIEFSLRFFGTANHGLKQFDATISAENAILKKTLEDLIYVDEELDDESLTRNFLLLWKRAQSEQVEKNNSGFFRF